MSTGIVFANVFKEKQYQAWHFPYLVMESG